MPDSLPERAVKHHLQRDLAPPRLLASWQRSENYGVSFESVAPVFAGTKNNDSLFAECGNEVLADLHGTLVNEPVSLILTDADGVVLSRLSGDHSLSRALDDIHLAPGFAYSERDVGTNGLGLALADRVPTLIRAEQHYALSLAQFSCAAAPVFDPGSGRLDGGVNLTTWSRSAGGLLLALARSAANNTRALMLARCTGRRNRPRPRGQVFRLELPQMQPGSETLYRLSAGWNAAVVGAEAAMRAKKIVAVTGEAGSGRATLLGQAARRVYPRDRILSAGAPAPEDVSTWLGLWAPELGKSHTVVIARDVDLLPGWVGEQLRELIASPTPSAATTVPFAVTTERFADIPAALARLVDAVIEVPPLRERPEDIMPIASHVAWRNRGRHVKVTPAAARALSNFSWPGNADQLTQVVTRAVRHSDTIDLGHLPSEVLAGDARRLSRIEAFERGEIIRVLSAGPTTMGDAAEKLGMSRATLYRKVARYGIELPHRQ